MLYYYIPAHIQNSVLAFQMHKTTVGYFQPKEVNFSIHLHRAIQVSRLENLRKQEFGASVKK